MSDSIKSLRDNILGVDYDLVRDDAKQTSALLKRTLKELGIKHENYNSDIDQSGKQSWEKDKMPKVAPKEIYEYQNFFLMERTDGKIILLDGFRRLLWFDTPTVPILYRLYNQKDITDAKLIQMLVNLNHTKFFGGIGDYFDRGFALALRLCFDLDILKYPLAFDAYITDNELKRGYSNFFDKKGQDKVDELTKRILNPKFVEDMRFIQGLVGKTVMLNSNFGVLLYQTRCKNPNFVFSADIFWQKVSEDKFALEFYNKFVKSGDTTSAESQKAVNRLIEIYSNIFDVMILGKTVETFMQMKEAAKAMSDQLKKDKAWLKITKSRNLSFNEITKNIVEFMSANNGKPPKIKVVVYPYDEKGKEDLLLPYGVYDDFAIIGITKYKNYYNNPLPIFDITQKGGKVKTGSQWGKDAPHFIYSVKAERTHQNAEVFISVIEADENAPKERIMDRNKQN